MANCLVTKLKSSIPNGSLMKLGVLKLKVTKEEVSTSSETTFRVRYIGLSSNDDTTLVATFPIIFQGVTYPSGEEIHLNPLNSVTNVLTIPVPTLQDGGYIYISHKYNLYQVGSGGVSAIAELSAKECSYLTSIRVLSGLNLIGDLKDLDTPNLTTGTKLRKATGSLADYKYAASLIGMFQIAQTSFSVRVEDLYPYKNITGFTWYAAPNWVADTQDLINLFTECPKLNNIDSRNSGVQVNMQDLCQGLYDRGKRSGTITITLYESQFGETGGSKSKTHVGTFTETGFTIS